MPPARRDRSRRLTPEERAAQRLLVALAGPMRSAILDRDRGVVFVRPAAGTPGVHAATAPDVSRALHALGVPHVLAPTVRVRRQGGRIIRTQQDVDIPWSAVDALGDWLPAFVTEARAALAADTAEQDTREDRAEG